MLSIVGITVNNDFKKLLQSTLAGFSECVPALLTIFGINCVIFILATGTYPVIIVHIPVF